jgi:hypothetical protein
LEIGLRNVDTTVMAGPVPAIHALVFEFEDVDARRKAGHDETDNGVCP